MAAPYRGNTGLGTYFVTANTFQKHALLQSERTGLFCPRILSAPVGCHAVPTREDSTRFGSFKKTQPEPISDAHPCGQACPCYHIRYTVPSPSHRSMEKACQA